MSAALNRVMLVPLVIGVMSVAACAPRIPRAGPFVWQLRGAVVSVTNDRLQVRHKTGAIVELEIDDRTEYVRNRRPDSRDSLLRGARLIVDVETLPPGRYRARRVQVFGGGRAE